MIKLYSCIADHHDLRLVVLAAIVCLLGAFTTGILVQHVAISRGAARQGWHATAAVAAGLAIWATHFIGMLAFDPALPHGYAIAPTVLSLILALAGTWLSMFLALRARTTVSRAVAGAVLGAGIMVMHYVGMSGFHVLGHLIWDPMTVAVSVGVAMGFGALAVLCLYQRPVLRNFGAPLAFVAAVCGGHFVGMSALTILPDPTVRLPGNMLGSSSLVIALVNMSAAICVLSIAAAVVSMRDKRRNQQEQARFRDLTDVALEGLVICDGDAILTTNQSFDALMGVERGALKGASIAGLVQNPEFFDASASATTFKTNLLAGDGIPIPAEIIRQKIDYGGEIRAIYAIRDMRNQERAAAELEFLANHDALTGLANRLRFGKRLEQQFKANQANGRAFAVLAVDLDRFKPINDSLGHAMGDAVLVRVARRLKTATRGQGVVARLGGDEFAILIDCAEDTRIATAAADLVVDLLGRPFLIDGNVIEIGGSVGVAYATPDAEAADQLMVRADLALYRAKADGRGLYRLFEPHMTASVQKRRSLEMELRRATARREFELHYQPQLNTVTGRIAGFEALLRWRHPERGLVPPDVFIPIAEDIGLILTIGEWVIQTACAEAATWEEPLSIAVNLSPLQCRSTKIIEVVAAALQQTGLAPERLELEITEGVLLNDNVMTLTILNALRGLGARISMDDFGTGYSSLSYLRSFPFDKIKIDKSFVSHSGDDKESASIVKAIIGLGVSLGISITAEGVETEEQMSFVRDHGCEEVQGYLVSRPMEAGQITRYLAGQATPRVPLKLVHSG